MSVTDETLTLESSVGWTDLGSGSYRSPSNTQPIVYKVPLVTPPIYFPYSVRLVIEATDVSGDGGAEIKVKFYGSSSLDEDRRLDDDSLVYTMDEAESGFVYFGWHGLRRDGESSRPWQAADLTQFWVTLECANEAPFQLDDAPILQIDYEDTSLVYTTGAFINQVNVGAYPAPSGYLLEEPFPLTGQTLPDAAEFYAFDDAATDASGLLPTATGFDPLSAPALAYFASQVGEDHPYGPVGPIPDGATVMLIRLGGVYVDRVNWSDWLAVSFTHSSGASVPSVTATANATKGRVDLAVTRPARNLMRYEDSAMSSIANFEITGAAPLHLDIEGVVELGYPEDLLLVKSNDLTDRWVVRPVAAVRVIEGQFYSAECTCRFINTGAFTMSILWLAEGESEFEVIGSSTTDYVAPVAFGKMTTTGTAPAGATHARVSLSGATTDAAEIAVISKMGLYAGGLPSVWFPGESEPDGTYPQVALVERSSDSGVTWEVVDAPQHGSNGAGIVYSSDRGVKPGVSYIYRASLKGRSGFTAASAATSPVSVDFSRWFLRLRRDSSLDSPLEVLSSTFQFEQESTILNRTDSRSPVILTDGIKTRSGRITARVDDADVANVKAMLDTGEVLILSNLFGEAIAVKAVQGAQFTQNRVADLATKRRAPQWTMTFSFREV
jgi:hypothetical protein